MIKKKFRLFSKKKKKKKGIFYQQYGGGSQSISINLKSNSNEIQHLW